MLQNIMNETAGIAIGTSTIKTSEQSVDTGVRTVSVLRSDESRTVIIHGTLVAQANNVKKCALKKDFSHRKKKY